MLKLSILTQPDCITCGPTCLQALYSYFEDIIPLDQIISEISYLNSGGTLAVLLGCHALKRGYQASLNTFNLHVIDPTWFKRKNVSLIDKLHEQLLYTNNPKIIEITNCYIKFLELGGKINFSEINFELICKSLDNNIPLLSGVSATFMYQNMRDYTNEENRGMYDEWVGGPSGHFILLRGYDQKEEKLYIADPYTPHPLSRSHYYSTSFTHWLHAHLLGVISNDAELLAIYPEYNK